ncbi:MAG: MFS transporter [Acidimicrobiia bacterium]|nr:MFS transporter [Acidimicrobiia bacterium]MYB77925.1 MFS transporter [Acidimicrobiia bacterium]
MGVSQQVTGRDLTGIRRRLLCVLFTGTTLGWVGFIATLTVATVAARSLTGSTTMAGIPLAAGALGQAYGTNLFGKLSAGRGRRFIMLMGPPISALGAAVEMVGVIGGWYWMLVGGAALVGVGLGSQHLSRYVAAELATEGRQGLAMGILVLSGTIGSVVGANLVEWMGRIVEGGLGTPYAGAFLLATVAFLLTWALFWAALRPDPSKVAVTGPVARTGSTEGAVGAALRMPTVQVAILAMVSAQVVMVGVMTATPLRIEDAGYGLNIVGVVISTHTVGMFLFAPLVGKLVDRVGYLPVLGIGLLMTWGSLLLAGIAPYEGYGMLNAGLFLLGLGWSFSFVAGSSMLFASAPVDVRQVVEGRADALTHVMVMTGSAGAGFLMSAIGFGLLNLVAAGFLLALLLLVSFSPGLRAALIS